MSIEFNCESCGKHYKVPDAMAGKRAKCKSCGGIIQVPLPIDEVAEAPAANEIPMAPVKVPGKPAAPPSAAKAPASSPKAPSLCPSCDEPLAPNAVLCTSCGFDLRKGVKIAGVDQNNEGPESPEDSGAEESAPGKEGKQGWWGRFRSKPK